MHKTASGNIEYPEAIFMEIVKTDVPMTSELNGQTIAALVARYPVLRTEQLGETAFGRPLLTLVAGNGPR